MQPFKNIVLTPLHGMQINIILLMPFPNYKTRNMAKQQRINPFKDICAIHNNGFDTVLKELMAGDEPVTSKRIHELTVKFLASQKIKNEQVSPQQVSSIMTNMTTGSTNQSVSQLLATKNVPQALINLALEAENINNNQDLESALEQLTDIERKILRSDFSREQIQYPLLYLSITRSSLIYWIDRVNHPERYAPPVFPTPSMAIIIAKADGKGALMGTGIEIIAQIATGHFGIIGVAGSAIEKSIEAYHKETNKRKASK